MRPTFNFTTHVRHTSWPQLNARTLLQMVAWLALVGNLSQSGWAKTYYLDANSGDDSRAGTSAKEAWKSLERANQVQLQPGDQLLLIAGGVWSGELAPQGSGSLDQPVLISRYGSGPSPRIAGSTSDAVRIENFSHLILEKLEITNPGDRSSPRRGVHVVAADCGTMSGIVLRDLYIHDVHGTNDKKDNGGIIFRTRGQKRASRFDGLLIERNIIWRVDRSGIAADSYHWQRDKWFPSQQVIIRDNLVVDVGGDGIVPWATEDAIVEHNIVRGANMRAGNYNAGIWPWSADRTVFRFNRVSEVKTLLDGQGFDSDYNSRGTRFEYNLSHNNEGGFMLICSPGKRDPRQNIGNQDTVVRRNISRHDGERIFHVSAAENTVIEQNYIYIAPETEVQLLLLSDWDGWCDGLLLRNNRYVNQGKTRSGHGTTRREDGSYTLAEGWGPAKNVRLEGNNEHATAIEVADWNGPQFDPANPQGFPEFLKKHRTWMEAIMQAHFGSQ